MVKLIKNNTIIKIRSTKDKFLVICNKHHKHHRRLLHTPELAKLIFRLIDKGYYLAEK